MPPLGASRPLREQPRIHHCLLTMSRCNCNSNITFRRLHPPKTNNIAPENRQNPKKETKKYSNHPFSGVNSLLVSGRVPDLLNSCQHIRSFFARQNSPKWTRVIFCVSSNVSLQFASLCTVCLKKIFHMWQKPSMQHL